MQLLQTHQILFLWLLKAKVYPYVCIKVVRGFIWTWSRLNMICSVGSCWVRDQAGR